MNLSPTVNEILNMNSEEEQLSNVPPQQRILLLSHCLRPSKTCPGKYSKSGLDCLDACQEQCTLGNLRRIAISLGYKGVCIAPGGRLAFKYVKEKSPLGIVAIACNKELEEGIEAVRELNPSSVTPIVSIPLTIDGCVDTVVDEKRAIEVINLGCSQQDQDKITIKRPN